MSSIKITRFGIVGNLTGSVQGTASYAMYASGSVLSDTVRSIEAMTSASYSAIIEPDPSTLYIITDDTGSVESASYAVNADNAKNAISSSFATDAASAVSASYTLTASYALTVKENLPLETGSAPYSIQSTTASIASGTASFAYGQGVTASGQYSHAEGFSTIASNSYEHAQGAYNVSEPSQIFSVGCGTGDGVRKNAISVITGSGASSSASVYIYGVGNYDGTTISGSVDLANVLIGIANTAAKKPVVLYETDGTTGLLGHNANTYEGHWQLEDYDFTPYKRLECFFKASATSSGDVYTPAIIVTIPLDEAAKGPSIYMGSQMVGLPFNRNRQYFVGCAVDGTKTKFQVVHQNTIWDITTSDANSVGRYMYKILGYFD